MIVGYQAVYDLGFFDAIDYASVNHFDFVSFDLNVPRFYHEEWLSSLNCQIVRLEGDLSVQERVNSVLKVI